jgi:murein DD-endopeptidase MepM/ murein hydrolase activator NlpD
VSAGQPIAQVGTTGASTGCHLHFELRVNGEKIDGIPFMRQRQAPLG